MDLSKEEIEDSLQQLEMELEEMSLENTALIVRISELRKEIKKTKFWFIMFLIIVNLINLILWLWK